MHNLMLRIGADISSALGAFKTLGSAIQNCASMALNIFKNATSTLIQWGKDVSAVTDRIDKLSQKLGLSRKAFQEWDYIMSQNGVNMNSMSSGMKRFGDMLNKVKTGADTSGGALASLDKKLVSLVRSGASQEEVFRATVKRFQELEDGYTKAALAEKLFGKFGQEMLPLLNASAGSIDELTQKANELGLVLSDDIINGGVLLTDLMDTLKRSFDSISTQLKATFLPILIGVCDTILMALPTILQGVTFVVDGLTKVFSHFGNVVGNILGMLGFEIKMPEVSSQATSSVEEYGSAMAEAGEKAKKSSKQVASFDEVIQLSSGDAGGSGGDIYAGAMGALTGLNAVSSGIELTNTKLMDGLTLIGEKLKKILEGFSSGFSSTFDISGLDTLKDKIKDLGNQIFSTFGGGLPTGVIDGLRSIPYHIGAILGSITSIGTSLGINLVGGLTKYLESSGTYINERFARIFTEGIDMLGIVANLTGALSDIFKVFEGENAQKITGDILGIFSNAWLGLTDLGARIGRDILGFIATPIIENKEAISEAFSGILGVVSLCTGLIRDIITDGFSSLLTSYDKYVRPMFQLFTDGMSELVGHLLKCFNDWIIPSLEFLGQKFREFYDNHLKEIISLAMDIMGKFGLLVGHVFNDMVVPLLKSFMDVLAPAFALCIIDIGRTFEGIGDVVGGCVKGMLKALSGLLDFITGIFTGNFELAWGGLLETLRGTVDAFKSLIKVPLNAIIDMINKVIQGLNRIQIKMPDWVKEIPGMGNVGSFGVNITQIPKLASGGVTKGETLALIGDNIGGKELVAPLTGDISWMYQLADVINQKAKSSPVNLNISSPLTVLDRYSLENVADILRPHLQV